MEIHIYEDEDIEDERDACVEWVIKGKEEITGIT